jgi:hypothetical protein
MPGHVRSGMAVKQEDRSPVAAVADAQHRTTNVYVLQDKSVEHRDQSFSRQGLSTSQLMAARSRNPQLRARLHPQIPLGHGVGRAALGNHSL